MFARILLLAATLFWPVEGVAADGDTLTFSAADFPPVISRDKNGEAQGLAVDVLNEISARTGTQFKIVLYPWKRALEKAKSGTVDGVIAFMTLQDVIIITAI